MELIRKSKEEFAAEGKPYAADYDDKETVLEKQAEVPYLHFHSFDQQEWLQLTFSTRLGGISEGYLSTLNLGWDRGEPRENVCENYRRYCASIGSKAEKLVLSDQVHETTVRYVDERFCAGIEIEKKLKGVDGMFTDIPELLLATSYADCVPLFFCDPVKRIIASSHSGWKGTVAGIGAETIRKLQEMGCQTEDIHALIGPSICQKCYEISEDVAKQFSEAYEAAEIGQILQKGRVTGAGDQKYQLDLWAANWFQLKRAGVQPEHIHLSGVCTCCNHELLFSHRASHGKRGNLNGFLRIRG